MNFDPSVPDTDTLTVHVTSSNRDLPARLPFGNAEGDFQLEGPGVFTAIRSLVKPTASLRPPLRRGAHWRLISHLALNVLSLVEREGEKGPEALREILRLYDISDSSVTRQQIDGISKLSARRVVRPLRDTHPGFVRGLEVSIELRRAELRRVGRLSLRVRARALSLALCLRELLQPARGVDEAARGDHAPLAAAQRRPDRAVSERLRTRPEHFGFFQAVRLLARLSPSRVPVGHDGPPARETARFRTRATLEFPPSEIHDLRAIPTIPTVPPRSSSRSEERPGRSAFFPSRTPSS